MRPHPAFFVGSEDLNSGPLAYTGCSLTHGAIAPALYLWLLTPASTQFVFKLVNIDFSTDYQMLSAVVCVGGGTGLLNFISPENDCPHMHSKRGMWVFVLFF